MEIQAIKQTLTYAKNEKLYRRSYSKLDTSKRAKILRRTTIKFNQFLSKRNQSGYSKYYVKADYKNLTSSRNNNSRSVNISSKRSKRRKHKSKFEEECEIPQFNISKSLYK